MTHNVQGFLLRKSGQVVLIVCVTRPYRTYTVFDFSIRLRYVRAGFSPVLLLGLSRPKRRDKDRKLKAYLPAVRRTPLEQAGSKARGSRPYRMVRSGGCSVGTRHCECSEAEMISVISKRTCPEAGMTENPLLAAGIFYESFICDH